jgi:hypothetical protein
MLKMTKLKTQSGSAILIALFIMATLGVLAFSTSKVYISEIRTTTNLNYSIAAYYAAEGSLERSLLAYRLNPNQEIPVTGSGFATPITLTNSAQLSQKMKYLGATQIGAAVAQDDTRQITLDGSGPSAKLSWVWGSQLTNTLENRGLRITYIDPITGDQLPTEPIFMPMSAPGTNLSLPTNPTIIRIRPIGVGLASYTVTPASGTIDTGISTIDALGEYGGVKRQLEAKIDRASNRLQSIFDYTILTKDSIN